MLTFLRILSGAMRRPRDVADRLNVCRYTTDRAGAVDADFHENLPKLGGRNFGADDLLASSDIPSQGNCLLTAKFCQAAEMDRTAAVASSSNAVEMSRMLMTPIKL